MEIQAALTENDILKCRSVIQTLRPSLTDDLYLEAVQKTLADSRQMIFIEENGQAVAAAVFETGYNLFRGKYIYIDDLSTLPGNRGKGYAGELLDWIIGFAQKGAYEQIHLDSGVSAARTDAHRLYLNKRFQITSMHFVVNV